MERFGIQYEEIEVMRVHVCIKSDDNRILTCKKGQITMIPFTGTVEGTIFNGIVCPGGCDVQLENNAQVRHMCARYMLEGKDSDGEPARIYIENNGWFTDGIFPQPFTAVPVFYTDSEKLAAFFDENEFIAKGYPGENGPDICFYRLKVCQGDGSC